MILSTWNSLSLESESSSCNYSLINAIQWTVCSHLPSLLRPAFRHYNMHHSKAASKVMILNFNGYVMKFLVLLAWWCGVWIPKRVSQFGREYKNIRKPWSLGYLRCSCSIPNVFASYYRLHNSKSNRSDFLSESWPKNSAAFTFGCSQLLIGLTRFPVKMGLLQSEVKLFFSRYRTPVNHHLNSLRKRKTGAF